MAARMPRMASAIARAAATAEHSSRRSLRLLGLLALVLVSAVIYHVLREDWFAIGFLVGAVGLSMAVGATAGQAQGATDVVTDLAPPERRS